MKTNSRSTSAWGPYLGGATGFTNTDTGESNTAGLAALGASYVPTYSCQYLTANGRDDWYLPSKKELGVLFTNRNAIGNFDTYDPYPYWSSSEFANTPTTYAWGKSFNEIGGIEAWQKTSGGQRRCVRK